MHAIMPNEFITENSANYDSVMQTENKTSEIENNKKYPRFT